jgi:hypothetical protein
MLGSRNALVAMLWTALAAVALSPAAATPAVPVASDGIASNVLFKTSLVSDTHPSGAYEGTLSLNFGRGGTILGYFHPVDSGQYLQVSGGLTGDRIYLDIDGFPPIEGTYADGKIAGYTFIHEDTHRFTAIRSEGPSL